MFESKKLSKIFKEKREEKGLSLNDVAIMLGTGKSTIHKYENEGTHDIDTIIRLCEIYDIDLYEIIGNKKCRQNIEDNISEYDHEKYEVINLRGNYKIVKNQISAAMKLSKRIFVFLNDEEMIKTLKEEIEKCDYKIQNLNFKNIEKSIKYNPLNFLKTELDIYEFASELIMKISEDNKRNTDEVALLTSIIFYLKETIKREQQNFTSVMKLLRAADIEENGYSKKSDLDRLFDTLAKNNPKSIALKQYMIFKQYPLLKRNNIIADLSSKLQLFNIKEIDIMTSENEIVLDDERTITFVTLPKNKMVEILYNIFEIQLSNFLKNH